MIQVAEFHLDGVLLLTPEVYADDRGFFSEVYNRKNLSQIGVDETFVQDNHSMSKDVGTIRGLHFQIEPHAIAKLVRVVRGSILDVAVDLRHGSPTYGEHVSAELSAENWKQIYVPIGFAHGFCTLEPHTEVAYKVTDYWTPDVDRGLAWDDPALGIDWPVDKDHAILSDKDKAQPTLAELTEYFAWSPR